MKSISTGWEKRVVGLACATCCLTTGSSLLGQTSASPTGPAAAPTAPAVTPPVPVEAAPSSEELSSSMAAPPPAPTEAEGEATGTTEGPRKRADALAMTVSGAVSLGSHEAGQLFLITKALRQSPESTPLRVTTGASAGSANALISANEACLRRDFTAEESLGYRTWVDVGLGDLFDPDRTTRQSIFHSDSVLASYRQLEGLWEQGIPEDCDFVFGVAVTRKPAADLKLAEGLSISRSAERFVVHVQGQGARPPRFSNYVDQKTSYHRPLLPFTGAYEDDAAALRPVVLASAAFPIAFPPQPIEYCVAGESKDHEFESCPEPTHVDLFVDGGVFDNNPLGIAYRTALGGLTRKGADVSLRERPDSTNPETIDVLYGFVDPDLRTYPMYRPAQADEESADDPVLSLVTRLGGQMLTNARGNELANLADENFALLEDLWLIHANYPPMSELLGAFFGFFERDFRDFDFHLGTYDSFVDLRDRSAARLGTEQFIEKLDRSLQGELSGVPKEYRKLACITSQVGPKKYRHLSGACQGSDMRNFRVLLQVAIDRLWSNCRFLTTEEVANTKHLGCKQAQGGILPPVVDSSFVVSGRRFQERLESDFDYTLRLLADYGFHFRDLGLSPKQASRARIEVRRQLIAMVEALSAAQGSYLNRTAVMTAGRTMMNTIYYEPPRRRAYVGIGSSFFAGYLGRLGENRAFYWNPDVRMMNLRELFTEGSFRFGAQATLGLEVALLPLSGSVWQTSFGARAGYQFAATDSIGFDTCEEDDVSGDSRLCSGPVIHAPFNFTLLERVRLAITPVFYPMRQDFGHNWFELEMGIGAELY